MLKRLLFSMLLVFTAFSCVGLANFPEYRVRFTINRPYLLERNADLAVPSGTYLVQDIGTSTGNILDLQRDSDHRHIAFLTTVRIDRRVQDYRDKTTVVFDYENTVAPILRQFYISETDGYEILGAKYSKDSKYFIETAS